MRRNLAFMLVDLAGAYALVYVSLPADDRRLARMWLLRELQLVCTWLALQFGQAAMWAELTYRREVMA